MSVYLTPTLQNPSHNWIPLMFANGRSLCPSLEITALGNPAMVCGGVRRKEMSTVNISMILLRYFQVTFPLPSYPTCCQLCLTLRRLQHTFYFLYKNTVLNRRVFLSATSKNSTLIYTEGQPSLNYQSALQQHSNYCHHLEWPKQHFEITSKTVVVINQGSHISKP